MVAASRDPEKIHMISLRRIVTISMANRSKTLCSLFILASLASCWRGLQPWVDVRWWGQTCCQDFNSSFRHLKGIGEQKVHMYHQTELSYIVHGTSQVEISQITIQLEAGRKRWKLGCQKCSLYDKLFQLSSWEAWFKFDSCLLSLCPTM
jgi:hypothetical protein